MSEPVANVDIEDVLSSIRRLVSNGPGTGGAEPKAVRDAERLVLTPSQRVDDADQAGDAEDDPAPVAWAGVTGAQAPDDAPDEAIETEADRRACEDVEAVPQSGMKSGIETIDDAELDGIAAMFARHEATAPTAWEPDGDDEDAFADAAEAPVLDWRDADVDGEASDDVAPQDAPDRATAYAHDWDTDTPDDADNVLAIEDEAVLDEEALRDLVAEIVREELMGSLGERITRNVRKLVRREIHRALNSQDFD